MENPIAENINMDNANAESVNVNNDNEDKIAEIVEDGKIIEENEKNDDKESLNDEEKELELKILKLKTIERWKKKGLLEDLTNKF